MAMIMWPMPGPSAAAIAMARMRLGKVSIRSVSRIMISSTSRPK